jgi:hypothetical protein
MTGDSHTQPTPTSGNARSRRRLLKALAGGLTVAAAAALLSRAAQEARADQYQVWATVHNQSPWPMQLTDSGLPWGNWVVVPQSIPAWSSGAFESTGRNLSYPTGTGGFVTWTLVGHPQSPTIRAGFSDPISGEDRVNIKATPEAIGVTVTQTHGDVDYVDFYVG